MLPSLKRWGRWPQLMDILPTHPYASQEATARWGATTHKETPAEHTPGHTGPSSPRDIIHLQRNHFHEGKKPKDSGVDRWTMNSMNLLSLFWPSLACLTGLSDMCNGHLEPASLGAHSPLVVYLHLTTAIHSASCYTKHKNKQIIQ